jgi:hypothetical protein
MDSAGHCQNPQCLDRLIVDTGTKVIHVAERAHVFAAAHGGPRADRDLSEEDRGSYENIILLCPTCHTTVDKAEEDFPPELLAEWKDNHVARIARLFGAASYSTRREARAAIEPLLAENHALFEALNPDLAYQANPEADEARKWQEAMVARIIPNNRRVLAILDENRQHLAEPELRVLECFRQHVLDQEVRHLTDIAPGDQQRFPSEMANILRETDGP